MFNFLISALLLVSAFIALTAGIYFYRISEAVK